MICKETALDADQSRMARAARAISLTQLSAQTGVGKNRISQFEKGEAPLAPESHEKVESYLSQFVIFVSEKPGQHGSGVLLRLDDGEAHDLEERRTEGT